MNLSKSILIAKWVPPLNGLGLNDSAKSWGSLSGNSWLKINALPFISSGSWNRVTISAALIRNSASALCFSLRTLTIQVTQTTNNGVKIEIAVYHFFDFSILNFSHSILSFYRSMSSFLASRSKSFFSCYSIAASTMR